MEGPMGSRYGKNDGPPKITVVIETGTIATLYAGRVGAQRTGLDGKWHGDTG
jgi:hypothetical protein